MTTLSAVVINFKRPDLLEQCLRSLEADLETIDGAEVIVVDNGSGDASVGMVRERFPDVRIVALPTNRGFAGGMRAGLAEATGDWVLTINNDATVVPGTAQALLRVASSDSRIGAVAAQMRFADGSGIVNSAGIDVDRLGIATDRLLGATAAEAGESCEVFGASAGAALYRRAMLRDIGGFEPSFFAYLEDVDVAWRARARGWRAVYAADAVVLHHHSATARHGSPFKYRLVGRNRVRLLARNATTRQLLRHGLAMVGYDLAYVGYVAVSDRTLAPLVGRWAGIRRFRTDRDRFAAERVELDLSPVGGLGRALGRRRSWARSSGHAA